MRCYEGAIVDGMRFIRNLEVVSLTWDYLDRTLNLASDLGKSYFLRVVCGLDTILVSQEGVEDAMDL